MKSYVGASTRTCMHKLWRDRGKFPGEHHLLWVGKRKHTSYDGLLLRKFVHIWKRLISQNVGWYRSKLKLWHDFSSAMNKHAVFKTEAIWISYQVLRCLRFIKTVLKMTSFNEPQALISFTIRRSWQCDRFLFITQPLKSKGKTSNMD